MEYLDREPLREAINQLAAADTPFLFLIDFTGEKGLAVELTQLEELGISCSMMGEEMGVKIEPIQKANPMESNPIPFSQYQTGFDRVMERIRHGDTYLLNLTYPTHLGRALDMPSIYSVAKARYKFMIDGNFLFYSPESFLQIKDGMVYSFPMKGTICADEEDARKTLLENKKELYEHYTIVDLIRNDLAIISSDVEVEEFRYVESIQTAKGEILQTSTKIRGKLPADWKSRLGDMLLAVIPAGSVSGAPKARTVQIIEDVELSRRGFYTGVMGVCRHGELDSCVIIRYLEQTANGDFYYRSGGGITALSNAKEEYNELLTKIYVPIV